MNNLKRFFVAVVLVSAFTLSTFAGGIECGNPVPPPSGGATAQSEPAITVQNESEITESVVSNNLLADAALALLQGVLAIF